MHPDAPIGLETGIATLPPVALDPDQPLDDLVNCIKLCEAALGDYAMRGTIGLFKHGVGLRVSCNLLSQRGDFLSRRAAKPKERSKRQRIRIEKYQEDAGGRPIKQFDMWGYVRPPCPGETRLQLHVTGHPFEFQRQIISAAVDLRPQNLQIPDVLAPKPAQ